MPLFSSSQAPGQPQPPAGANFGELRRRIGRRGVVNLVLIGTSVLVSIWTNLGQNTERLMPLFISLYPARDAGCLLEVRHGELWRLFTPAFLHFGIAHIGLNMANMWTLGDPLERVEGPRFYLLFTAVVALFSNLGQYLVSGSYAFGGMSGVIFGLFGYVWLRGKCDPAYLLRLQPQAIYMALLWFAFCLSGVLPIANTAHAVGLAIGAGWGAATGLAAVRRARAGLPFRAGYSTLGR